MLALNKLFFPKPNPPGYDENLENLIYIEGPTPTNITSPVFSSSTKKHRIPCLEMNLLGASNMMIYFHGNGEDLGYSQHFLEILRDQFKCHVLCMEYPGYGVYQDKTDPSEKQIFQDAEIIYDYAKKKVGGDENVILFGRSMGGGSAAYLASKYQPKALILMSAFSSLQAVSKDHYPILGHFVEERFKNAEKARQITCPTLIVHGKSDTLIPAKHGQAIFENLKSEVKFIHLPPKMTHNNFSWFEDIIDPTLKLLNGIEQRQIFN